MSGALQYLDGNPPAVSKEGDFQRHLHLQRVKEVLKESKEKENFS